MNSSVWTFVFIWGVWLITPILIDGIDTMSRLLVVLRSERHRRRRRIVENEELPSVSVVVPAHNEAAVIDRCLDSIKNQDYPSNKLEIIVVDDGSTDETAFRVEEHLNGNGNGNGYRLQGRQIKVGPFDGTLALIKNGHGGKAHALNAGIRASSGEIVINVDSDVVLGFDAVRRIAEAFVHDPELGAATGNIEVDWDVLEARDENGQIVLDENGEIVPADLSWMERFLAKSQFVEYLHSFDLGRRSQAITRTMYTLAGACSAFRREVITHGIEYENTTVSEDTCLTFDLHRRDIKIGFVHEARVYLEPVVEWDELYAQRVRWSRGQMEVAGLNEDIVGGKPFGRFGRVALPKMLLLDHTIAFPRLVWAPLLLFFPLIGYSWRIVAIALVAMYLFYLLIEIINTLALLPISNEHTRDRLDVSWVTLLAMPVYRFVVFHFRFAGFLVTFTEDQQWTVAGPVSSTQEDLRALRLRSIELTSFLTSFVIALGAWMARNAQFLIPPAVVGAIYAALRWLEQLKRL